MGTLNPTIPYHTTIRVDGPSERPELTGDRFPLPVNTGCVDGRAFPLAESSIYSLLTGLLQCSAGSNSWSPDEKATVIEEYCSWSCVRSLMPRPHPACSMQSIHMLLVCSSLPSVLHNNSLSLNKIKQNLKVHLVTHRQTSSCAASLILLLYTNVVLLIHCEIVAIEWLYK